MPVYLVHGFRWPREGFSGIRVHAIVHNLEECSVEYIQNENSREEILGSFRKAYADLMKDLETNGRTLEFIEQHDPEDTSSNAAVSQPYAYVADKVVEIAGQSITLPATSPISQSKPVGPLLSINVEEVIADGPGLTTKAWEALADLRDKIAVGEKIGWWIVYNGDPGRAYDSEEEDEDEDYEEEEVLTPVASSGQVTALNKEVVLSEPEAGPPVPPKTAPTDSYPDTKKSLPTRTNPEATRKEILKPEAVLSTPKDEKIPEPLKLKEVAKTSGFRKKFFGKKI